MIIGVSGKSQAGKDTIGEYLVKEFGFHRLASADVLKRIARNIFGWDGVKDAKGRKLLQDLGCSIRAYNEDYWIGLVLTEMQRQTALYGAKDFVVTDVRFKNEVALLKEKGAIILRVERDGVQKYEHVSETELDDYDSFAAVLHNNSTVADLESALKTIVDAVQTGIQESRS